MIGGKLVYSASDSSSPVIYPKGRSFRMYIVRMTLNEMVSVTPFLARSLERHFGRRLTISLAG